MQAPHSWHLCHLSRPSSSSLPSPFSVRLFCSFLVSCDPGYHQTHSVVKDDQVLILLTLPLPLKGWDQSCGSPRLVPVELAMELMASRSLSKLYRLSYISNPGNCATSGAAAGLETNCERHSGRRRNRRRPRVAGSRVCSRKYSYMASWQIEGQAEVRLEGFDHPPRSHCHHSCK